MELFERASREGFRRALAAGLKIAMGSDSSVLPHGENAREIVWMAKNGMTPIDAIRAATVRASELIGWEDRVGTVASGKFADLVAVRGNPARRRHGAPARALRHEGRRRLQGRTRPAAAIARAGLPVRPIALPARVSSLEASPREAAMKIVAGRLRPQFLHQARSASRGAFAAVYSAIIRNRSAGERGPAQQWGSRGPVDDRAAPGRDSSSSSGSPRAGGRRCSGSRCPCRRSRCGSFPRACRRSPPSGAAR